MGFEDEAMRDGIDALTDAVTHNLVVVGGAGYGRSDQLRAVLSDTIALALQEHAPQSPEGRGDMTRPAEPVPVARLHAAEALFDAAIEPTSDYLGDLPTTQVAKVLHGTIVRHLIGPAGGETSPLTAREQEVLTLVAAAKTNRQVGAELHISPGTVKRHLANITEKLNAVSRLDAVRIARLRSLI